MRGNFNLHHGVSVWDYYEHVRKFNQSQNNLNEEIMKFLLKFLGFNKKRKEFQKEKSDSSPYEKGITCFFTSFPMKKTGLKDFILVDYLGLSVYRTFSEEKFRIKFGIGHIYDNGWKRYFSTTNYTEVIIPENYLEGIIKGNLTNKEKENLQNILENFKSEAVKWIHKNLSPTQRRKFLGKKFI